MAGRRLFLRVVMLVTALAAIMAGFLLITRPVYLNWGSTADERAKRLPGDEIVPHAGGQTTRAITIHAPAEDAWPWVAQLGQDRGGFYSFDLLENAVGCKMPTVDVLRARHQVWQLGEKLWMYPSDQAGGAGFATLRVYRPGRVLGFATRAVGTSLDQTEDGSWTFVLQPAERAGDAADRSWPRSGTSLAAWRRIRPRRSSSRCISSWSGG